jgi:hypothetical protein
MKQAYIDWERRWENFFKPEELRLMIAQFLDLYSARQVMRHITFESIKKEFGFLFKEGKFDKKYFY